MIAAFTQEIDDAHTRCEVDPEAIETGPAASLSGGGTCKQARLLL